MSDRLLTIRELAAVWGWSPARLRRLVDARRIPFVQLPSDHGRGRIVFRESVVTQWLTERTVPMRERAPFTAVVEPPLAPVDAAEECRRLEIPVDHEFA